MMEVINFSSTFLLAEGSFGLNTNILETNLINQLILAVGLIFFGRDILGSFLLERKTSILTNVQNSEARLSDATLRLEEAKKQLTQAELIMSEILQETKSSQLIVLDKDYEQTKTELIRKFSSALASLKNKERTILVDITQQIFLLSIEQVVQKLQAQNGTELDQVQFMNNRIQMISNGVSLVEK